MALVYCFYFIGAILFLGTDIQSVSSSPAYKAAESNVFCYFGSWATYRWGIALFDVTNIDTSLCTHVVYAYTGVTDGVIASLDPYNDYDDNNGKGTMKKFVAQANAGKIKALVGIGGWNAGSVKFSQMASTADGRDAFADSVVEFAAKFGFHGLQIDWEYPTMMGGSPDDKDNFVSLLKTLSEKFKEPGLILSVGVAANAATAASAYSFTDVSTYADNIILLSFDYHTSYDGVTAIGAPLDANDKLNVNSTVHQWLDGGASAEKLIVGVPLYGSTAHLADASKHGLGDTATGPGTAGQFTQQAGILAYFEYCTQSGWTVEHSDSPVYTYAYHDSEWINYDDSDTVTSKAKYVLDNGLGGLMFYSLESEDFGGHCGKAYPILTAANDALGRLS